METLRPWLAFTRYRLAPMALAPALVGAGYAFYDGFPLSPVTLLLAAVGAVFAFLGLAALAGLLDYVGGDYVGDPEEDDPRSGEPAARLARRELSIGEAILATVIPLLAAAGVGLALVRDGGSAPLLIGVGAVAIVLLIGAPQIGLRALGHGLAELGAFLLLGPLPVIGAYLALTGRYSAGAGWAALPLGCFGAAAFYSLELARADRDLERGTLSPVVILGETHARRLVWGLPLAGYLAVALDVALGEYPPATLICLLTALPLGWAFMRHDPSQVAGAFRLSRWIAALYGAAGVLIALGLFLG